MTRPSYPQNGGQSPYYPPRHGGQPPYLPPQHGGQPPYYVQIPPQQGGEFTPDGNQQPQKESKKYRIIGFSVGAVALIVVIALICVLVFLGKTITSTNAEKTEEPPASAKVAAADLAQRIQSNIRDGRDISEFLCVAPSEPLKYGAFTPYAIKILYIEGLDIPAQKAFGWAVSHNPQAEIKVEPKSVSSTGASLRYRYDAEELKRLVSDQKLSQLGATREDYEDYVDQQTRYSITDHFTYKVKPKEGGSWCVSDEEWKSVYEGLDLKRWYSEVS